MKLRINSESSFGSAQDKLLLSLKGFIKKQKSPSFLKSFFTLYGSFDMKLRINSESSFGSAQDKLLFSIKDSSKNKKAPHF